MNDNPFQCVKTDDEQLALTKAFVDVQHAQIRITLGAAPEVCPNCVYYANLLAAMSGMANLYGPENVNRFMEMIAAALQQTTGIVIEAIPLAAVDSPSQSVH